MGSGASTENENGGLGQYTTPQPGEGSKEFISRSRYDLAHPDTTTAGTTSMGLFNRPPQGGTQAPGYSVGPTSAQQTIPSMSAAGTPGLQTSPSAVNSINPLPNPNSSTLASSSNGYQPSGMNSTVGGGQSPMMGSQPMSAGPAGIAQQNTLGGSMTGNPLQSALLNAMQKPAGA